MQLKYGTMSAIWEMSKQVKYEDWDIPITYAIQITSTLLKIQTELAALEKERVRLLKKFAETDDKGNIKEAEDGQAIFPNGKRKEFEQAFANLLNEEVDLSITPLKIDFEDPELKKVIKKPKEISFLLPLLDMKEQ